MLISKPLTFASEFIESFNAGLREHNPDYQLTRIQKNWLAFCITAILITNSVCWAKFERTSMGRRSMGALSWIFKKSKIQWGHLLQASVMVLLRKYNITEGLLAIDDSDKRRSKSTQKIAHVHKIKDKPSGGYIMGQSLVFMILVTPKITIPVGFDFYMPDPALKEWKKKIACLKKNKVSGKRPAPPERDSNYPTIPNIALALIGQFNKNFGHIRIRAILADALYGTKEFMDGAASIYPGTQVISQIRSNQNIRLRGKRMSVESYFAKHQGSPQKIVVRGQKEVSVMLGSARLYVEAHSKKRFVIALKYEGEEEYRYIIASNLSWRTNDIVEAYTFRWLVEVFFQDWKGYEGFAALTKHPGADGSSRSLILSLLTDHALFFHPEQLARIENKLPAWTVGSLTEKIKVEVLSSVIKDIIDSSEPVDQLRDFAENLVNNAKMLCPSKKHLVDFDLGIFNAVPALKYRGLTGMIAKT